MVDLESEVVLFESIRGYKNEDHPKPIADGLI